MIKKAMKWIVLKIILFIPKMIQKFLKYEGIQKNPPTWKSPKLMFQPCRLSWPTSTPNQIRFVSQKLDNNLQRKEKAAFEGFFNSLLAVRRVPNPKDYNTNLYFFQKLHSLKSTELLVHVLKENSKSAKK